MNQGFNPGDLLSGLAANPELLKNAMQMASALASSGVLDGLLGKGDAAPTPPKPSESAPLGEMGSFAQLLSSLGSTAPSPVEKQASDGAFEKAAPAKTEHHRPPAPCHQDRVRLLQAICPFLPEPKREKVHFLIKVLEVFSTAEQMGLGRLF